MKQKQIDYIIKQIQIGIQDEMEHTDSVLVALKIVLDHFIKHGLDYYEKLNQAGL